MSDIDELKRELFSSEVKFTEKEPEGEIEDKLAHEFNRIVLPTWFSFIILESGIVSLALGFALLYSPFVLIYSGLVQAIAAGAYIFKKIKEGRREKKGSKGGGGEGGR